MSCAWLLLGALLLATQCRRASDARPSTVPMFQSLETRLSQQPCTFAGVL
ncbi:MAG: hypothetical protein ACFB9M_07915 [Myxococcota bacterium]